MNSIVCVCCSCTVPYPNDLEYHYILCGYCLDHCLKTDMSADVRMKLSRQFGDLFKSDNASFDRDRFRLAVSK